MSIVPIYSHQYPWRRWSRIYPDLGDLAGKQVVDLGCGIGDQARDLARLGADVLGVDGNPELIDHARSRAIPRARFLCDNIKDLRDHASVSDGVWASFTAAYFPQFELFLQAIDPALKAGGWLAVTEVDNLLNHDPLDARWRTLIDAYYDRSLAEGVYRFQARDHVRAALSRHGWHILVQRTLDDDEFYFDGPAHPDVLEAWKIRLQLMMPRFRERFGEAARGFDGALLECLAAAAHRSRSHVWFLLARSPRKRGDATSQVPRERPDGKRPHAGDSQGHGREPKASRR